MHGHYEGCGGKWGAGRYRRGRFGGYGFGGGRFGMGGDMGGEDLMRARRMLAQGDLRLVALALIAEQPRHGYEIIKLVEEKTADWYSPSPGVVYPTLTYIEEAGYVTASIEGAKKLYAITDAGRAYLDANRDIVDLALAEYRAALKLDPSAAQVVSEEVLALLEVDPNNQLGHWLAGDALTLNGQFRKAVEQYLVVLKRDPEGDPLAEGAGLQA